MKKPKIRFKGYQEDWEQRKLSELGQIMTGSTPSTSKSEYYSEDGIPWVTPTDIEATTILDTPRKLSEEGAKVGRVVPANTILCTCIASIGKNTLLMVKGSFNQQINSLTPYEENDAYFLLTESELWSNKMKRMAASGTMQIVNKTEFSELQTMVPKSAEQKQIGSYFRNLDHLITLHQRKCEETKTLKKYMLQKMFPQNGHSVPEIRFSGFTEDWEQRKLGDIASSFEYGLNAAAKEYDGENKYIRITDIDDNTHEFLTDNLTSPDIDLTGADNYKLTEGDILFARTGASVGKSYIYRNSDGLVYYAGFLIRARIKEEYDAEFVFQNTLTDRYNKYIAVTSQRSGQPGVNAQEYAEFEIEVPKKEEQTKIGTYFRNIDHLITLHQRKCEEMKILKKYMLQKMFPQNGQLVPQIRFSGFTEDWEQRKVTELLKNSSSAMKIGPFGSALKKEYFVEEGIKVYAQENAFTGDFSMGDYYITEDKYKELKSCELYPGDLVISMMGTIGACAIFPKNAEKGIMNSHLLRLQFNNEVIPEYIMYLLRDSVLIRKQIDRLSVGSIMSGLSSSVVKKLVFPIPKLAEQKRIVEYLDSIDRLITLHQQKCDELRNIKKFMLQNMFI